MAMRRRLSLSDVGAEELTLELDELELSHTDWRQLCSFTSLKSLTLQCDLDQLPAEVCQLSGLTSLCLHSRSLTHLPESVSRLKALQQLDLSECRALTQLPESISRLGALQKLSLSSCHALTQLPESFGSLQALEQLDLSNCRALKKLPASFGSLRALRELVLHQCYDLTELPTSFDSLQALQRLYLGRCVALTQLPTSFGSLRALRELDLHRCYALRELPTSFGSLGALRELDLQRCGALRELPASIGSLGALQQLDLSECGALKQLSKSFGRLGALEQLDLSKCGALTQLPKSFGSLGALRELNLSSCMALKLLPKSFGSLDALQKLNLSSCMALKQLPESFGSLGALRQLDMRECRALKQLPGSMAGLAALEDFESDFPASQLPSGGLTLHAIVPSSGYQLLLGILEQQKQQQQQQRQAAVTKLATQQDTMLTTLERMSWLVLLLATATFIAFMQPPGSYGDNKVLGSSRSSCSGATLMQCAMLLFFVLDGLSFGLSMGCLMMIVALSMPRIQWADERAEAGRFYLLLLSTWLLLYLAVSTGFAAFIASGLAVHEQVQFVIGPVVPGMVLVVLGLGMMVWRFIGLYPGWDAIAAAFSRDKHAWGPVETEIELGQQQFWRDYHHGRVQALLSAGQGGAAGGAHVEMAPLLPPGN